MSAAWIDGAAWFAVGFVFGVVASAVYRALTTEEDWHQ